MRSRSSPSILVAVVGLMGSCTSSHDAGQLDASIERDASFDGGRADAGESRMCLEPSDCIVASVGCCPACGRPALDDVVALRRDALPARRERCKDMLCPACAESPNPSLVATCAHGRCEAGDITQVDAISACRDDGDCRIRVTSCCECGGDTSPYALVAVSVGGERALTDLVCNQNPVLPCPECAPVYPSNVTAACPPTQGHCMADVR